MASDLRLRQDLHIAPALFFTLRQEIDRERFYAIVDTLERHAGPSQGASREGHWAALKERIAGHSPWSSLVPAAEKVPETLEERNAWARGLQVPSRMLKERPYTSYVIDEIQYVVDVFNPQNELGLGYVGAGNPVLALLLGEVTLGPPQRAFQPLPVRDRLVEIASFYRILEDLMALLSPQKVCGGAYLLRVMLAYHSGEISPLTSPWDLLWTLTSVRQSEVAAIPKDELRAAFSKIVEIPATSMTLLQVVPGFDSVMSREYTRAARLLKRTAVTEVGGGPRAGR